ncbi:MULTISPECIES: peptidylprolyl isomerase PrsA [unclassified Bacillus (in: firmicutes)]|uniref:peptidylprolyl isomerase PrsA n=1 Tax=unclassified Bacillus (in: firmicutes) TaxID=185979 RepID=UPI0008DF70EF|nr:MULTISPECIES: peptidylprolyl isomerase PrsA [unclassified Bacillus (in: firmicutes)]SFJ58213.1 foldase protein PrsA [Bacillus sp. 71mf]SFS68539.1 foldase protein PrsA [Bacillus sp. 103mf]
MKKAMLALAVTSVFTLSACGTSDKVVTSKAGDVTKDDFYNAMKQQGGKNVLRNLVMEKVFIKNYPVKDDAVNKRFDEYKKQYGDQFSAALKQSGMTEKQLKETVRAELSMKEAVKKSITDKEIKDNYKPEIKASHILVKDEATAKKVKDELAQGKSFEELAKQYSEDPGSKEKGGDLGYFTSGKMVKEFEDAAYKLKKDEVSDPVKSQFGYHIIKVTDIKELKPLDQEKDRIKNELVDKKMQDPKFMNDLVTKEMKKADVKIEDKDLKDVFETPKAEKESK